MARRISTGISGKNVLGSIVAVQNSLRSVVANEDVVLQATGTGITTSATDFQVDSGNSLRLADDDGSNYVALTAPATVASNVTLTLPATAGTDGYTLVTNGSGVLNWAPSGLAVANRTAADNNNYYLAMVDLASVTSGNEDTLSVVDNDRLQYNPNTNILTVGNISASSITATTADINGGSVDGAAIGANSRSTGAFTTLAANGATSFTGTTTARQLNPETTNTYDLGTNSLRWRNIYTQDLHLSNGIGDYTVVEGEEDLFLVNNLNKKSFKFALIEVDPAEVPPKSKVD